jgi:AraC family transcriptional regulator
MELMFSHTPFSGRTVRSCTLAGLSLVETTYPPRLKMPRHTHEPAYFGLVLQGAYTEQCGRKSRTCQPSALVFHPPDEGHAVEFHQAAVRIFRVEVSPPWLERVREHSPILDGQAEFQGGWPAWLATRLYREFQEPDEFAPLALEGLTLEILAAASRRCQPLSEAQPPRWLRQARELLHAQLAEPPTLSRIAEAVAVHPVYLAREFRRHFHCTMGEYLRRLRIERACREMAHSDAPLAEIAALAGFYDQSHFCRTFKRLTGMTPAEYRAVFRAG